MVLFEWNAARSMIEQNRLLSERFSPDVEQYNWNQAAFLSTLQ
jgi:hypothetical protein